MEHWRQPSIPSVKGDGEEISRSFGILAVTSGNVQAYAFDTTEGIENRAPVDNTALEGDRIKSASSLYNSQVSTSSSHPANLDRLHARRQRHANGIRHGIRPPLNQARPYLTCEKYLIYKDRQRFELGKDGAPVWDPIIEEAFQDALVQIAPMGRGKRNQRGKLFGRNELITEYICRKTGAMRNRKQISSHIQVLNRLLKGIPEWDAVIKTSKDQKNAKNRRSYDTPIRDMDHDRSLNSRVAHHTYPSSSYNNDLPPPAFTLGSNTDHAEKHFVTKVNFEMWVSPPNPTPAQMTHQLHQYTKIQCCDSSSQPVPLENTKDWRLSFPHLPSVLEHTSLFQACDVILLEASFRLMPDFPPPLCKLGINLELDFRHPMADTKALKELHGWKWICVTRMYEHGKCVQQTHHHCDLTKKNLEVGKVAPSFESKYWAEKFVNLVEKKRSAEESGNEAAISAANEDSRNYFSGLSAMQELVAYAPHEVHLLETQSKPPQGKRMAILLWRFCQAQASQVGITTWQRLIPPPHKNTLNSPSSAYDLALPPLAMDRITEDMQVDPSFSIDREPQSQQGSNTPYHFYETTLDDNANLMGRDEYNMNLGDEDLSNLTAMPSSYGVSIPQGDFSQSSFPGLDNFPFDYPHQGATFGELNIGRQSTNIFFESQQGHRALQYEEPITGFLMAPQAYRMPELSRPDTAEEQGAHRQPLNGFDHSTHDMLQAQLEQSEGRDHNAEENALQAVVAAASAMNDLGAQSHSHYSHSHQRQPRHSHVQENSWETPFTSQPPLPHYSCYATQHSSQLPVEEHLTLAMDRGALGRNQIVSAFQFHPSDLGASTIEFGNHGDNQDAPVSHNADHNFPPDSAVAFAQEIAIETEVEDSVEP